MPNTSFIDKVDVATKISESPVLRYPFDHCIVDNVFPKNFFNEIHDNWPSDEIMTRLPDTGRTQEYEQRMVMLYEDRFFKNLSDDLRRFWLRVAGHVMGPQVLSMCYRKFKSILYNRIKHLPPTVTLDPEILVVSDRSNYSIGPHTDSRARFVSLLFYLSPDPVYKLYGTGLYKPKDPEKKTNHLTHHKFSEFELCKFVEYIPNRLLIFPRTDSSYHGVEPLKLEKCDRRLFIVNIKAPEGAK